jgi:hypothetical protein
LLLIQNKKLLFEHGIPENKNLFRFRTQFNKPFFFKFKPVSVNHVEFFIENGNNNSFDNQKTVNQISIPSIAASNSAPIDKSIQNNQNTSCTKSAIELIKQPFESNQSKYSFLILFFVYKFFICF